MEEIITKAFRITVIFALIFFVVFALFNLYKANRQYRQNVADCLYWINKVEYPKELSKKSEEYERYIANPELYKEQTGYESPKAHYDNLNRAHMRIYCQHI